MTTKTELMPQNLNRTLLPDRRLTCSPWWACPRACCSSPKVPPRGLLEEEKNHAQEIVNEGTAQLKAKGFTVQGHLAVGEPVEEVCELAAELKCDVIVVGHQQKASFASRWWRGSVGKDPARLLAVQHLRGANAGVAEAAR